MAINSSPSPSPALAARNLSALVGGFGALLLWRLTWAFLAWHFSGLRPSLESFQAHRDELEAFIMEQPWVSWLAFLGVYTLICGLCLDGTATLVVVAGALFGGWRGLAACTLGSTLGALAAFCFSRALLRSWFENHFRAFVKTVNSGLQKDGDAWLLSARLFPGVSFSLVTLAMGLTAMKPARFCLLSTLGLLPCNAAYVWAGMHLARIQAPRDLLSPSILLILCVLGLLPLALRATRRFLSS